MRILSFLLFLTASLKILFYLILQDAFYIKMNVIVNIDQRLK